MDPLQGLQQILLYVFLGVVAFFLSLLPGQHRESANEREGQRFKGSARNLRMNEKSQRKSIGRTERSTPGRNWELFKNNLPSPSSVGSSGKENREKFPRIPIRKKIHTSTFNGATRAEDGDKKGNERPDNKLTKHLAMDCEMVGIGDGTESMIARVSIVNRHCVCVYDKYVKPMEPVRDYRTKVSGIRPHQLQNGEEFAVVQREVAEILKGRILIGHALKHDFDVLYLSHPRKYLRDTSSFNTFKQLSKGRTPSLKKLAHELLGREIQTGEHSSVEDAKAAMQLYVLYRNKWESELYKK